MTPALHVSADQRLQQIEQARRAVMVDGRPGGHELGWIERSWRRCLARGRRPDQRVSFDVIPAQAARRWEEANHGLVQAARPVLDRLGRAIKSCNTLAVQHQGAEVTTIEGLAAPDGTMHPMQAAFKECHGLQCGFCTPGMVISAIDLCKHNPKASETEIRELLEGNICRCTGYQNIVKAVQQGQAALA